MLGRDVVEDPPDQSALEEAPCVLNEADVNVAIDPRLLMHDELMGSELVHLPVDAVGVRVEGLHVRDVLSNDAPDFLASEIVEDSQLDIAITGRHSQDVGAAFPACALVGLQQPRSCAAGQDRRADRARGALGDASGRETPRTTDRADRCRTDRKSVV